MAFARKGTGMSELAETLRDMADMLDGPQNAGNLVVPAIIHRFRETAETIERLEAENADLREQVGCITAERDILHEDNSTLRTMLCVFCKENSRLEGMISGCAQCRYKPKGADS